MPSEDSDKFDRQRRAFLGKVASGSVAGVGLALPHDAAGTAAASNLSGSTAAAPSTVTITVNGKAHELSLDARTTLLDALRDHLHLTGTKKGCDRGQCGACTIIVDGRRVNACLTLAVMHGGASIETVEGLADSARGNALQQAFLEHDGFQCGFCTPGQLCSAKAMLGEAEAHAASMLTADLRHGAPVQLSDAEIRERMSGNLCRCGAYANIVSAISEVSKAKG